MVSQTERLNGQICTLVYHENEMQGSESGTGEVLIVAKWKQSEGLSLFTNPRWRDFVKSKHHGYLEDLLQDFRDRRQFEPAKLFEQLCSLRVGPLITRDVLPSSRECNLDIPSDFLEFE